MAMPWFRVYSEFQDDPDIQMLSEHMQRRFIMLLCSRCKTPHLSDKVIAFQWRCDLSVVAETKALFLERGFIDEDWNVKAWDKRQHISDSSTQRVKKFRSALQKRSSNAPGNAPEQNRTEIKGKGLAMNDDDWEAIDSIDETLL